MVDSARCHALPLFSLSSITSRQESTVWGCNAFSRASCNSLIRTVEPGKCFTVHSVPAPERYAVWVGHHCSTSLAHHRYIDSPSGPTCMASESLASTSKSVLLAHSTGQTWLCDSVCPVSPQISRVWLTSVANKDAPVLCANIAVLLVKVTDVIEPVPHADMR